MRRTLYLAIIALVIVLVVLAGAYFRYRGDQQQGGLPDGRGSLGTLPQDGQGQNGISPQADGGNVPGAEPPVASQDASGVLTNQYLIQSYFADEKNDVIATTRGGEVVRISPGGKATVLATPEADVLLSSSFSSDGEKILGFFGDREVPRIRIFDVREKTWHALGEGITSPAWSPLGHTLAYVKPKGALRALETLDTDRLNETPKELFTLHESGLAVHWTTPERMTLFGLPSAFALDSLWTFDIAKKTITPLVAPQLGATVLWAADGARGLLFASSQTQRGGVLHLIDARGTPLQKLNLLTLPEKCAFDSRNETLLKTGAATSSLGAVQDYFLYCAIPDNSEVFSRVALPDTYRKRALFSVDSILMIDLGTGETTPIPHALPSFDAHMLKVVGKKIYFINRFDEKLYVLHLSS